MEIYTDIPVVWPVAYRERTAWVAIYIRRRGRRRRRRRRRPG
jgi:hypothetical protein